MFSATAIADFLACKHLTAVNRALAEGEIEKPYFEDPGLDLLKKLGLAHEQEYLRYLAEDRGLEISKIPDDIPWKEAAAQTVEAIQRGAEVIYQATFVGEQWHGRADFIVRVEKPSALGAWSYEVVETKLARSTKARAIIQLCFYSDLLSRIQGVEPDYMHVVLGRGAEPEKFFVQRYLAYFRKVRREFEEAYRDRAATYPEPVELCRVCDWSSVCDQRWRQDDHLSLVAGITRNQRKELVENRVTTVAELGRLALPAQPTIERIGDQALLRIREQARLQMQGREEGHHVYELLVPAEAGKGLCSLPTPSPGDMFLDFEGDPFAFDQGLEYLFGVVTRRGDAGTGGRGDARTQLHSAAAPRLISEGSDAELTYEATWAFDRAEEKKAFEKFIGTVMERWRRYPNMHIYHYGAYEETAIKRMAGQHATSVEQVDQLLRGDVLVDLYRAVRQGLRASVESYSIKKLEPLYEFNRDVRLIDANLAVHTFQAMLAFGPGNENLGEDLREILKAIEGYNRDDCMSTLRLRDWLEDKRTELETTTGAQLPRPTAKESAPGEDLSAYLERVRAVADRLTANLPASETEWTEEQRGRWLLAQLLEWHRREDKSAWWEYFRRCELTDEELQQDKSSLGGLVFLGPVETIKRSIVHRYQFPLQDHAIDRARSVHDPRTQSGVGEIVALDKRALTIDIKRGASSTVPHPTALIPDEIVGSKVLRESLLQLGSWVADNGIDGPGSFQAARDLLLRKTPRVRGDGSEEFFATRGGHGVPPVQGGARDESIATWGGHGGPPLQSGDQQLVDVARQLGVALDNSVLPIQGPPGSGKTYTGARMIVELVKQKKRVGITAVSHKVISKLLEEVCAAAREASVDLQAIQKVDSGDGCQDTVVKCTGDNEEIVDTLANRTAQVAAGTVWLWSRDDMAGAVDVLFVDEAGQMSLANVLAASKAAASVVLLGDPQQLDQPQRGVHPPGAEASALSHLLNGRATIGEDQGLFLSESWRLHPDVCMFTSEVFYDGRLVSRPANERQRLNAQGGLDGTGLRFAPVNHCGNQSESPEEVARVAELVDGLLRHQATSTNKKGEVQRLTLDNILIVAPYNAQVSALLQTLPPGARVGTVDKFQGQEAPVVFYSMTTSTPEDAPRGMEFLYSSNRLNVATSRAQCVTVLVASPALFDVECKTPRQIELANAFCRYLELAQVI